MAWGFAAQEIALLSRKELLTAEAALDELFQRFEAHLLPESTGMLEDYVDILGPQFFAAFETAQAAAKIDPHDFGFEAAVSFCAFLKSMRYMMENALRQDKSLLFVMPAFNDLGGSFEGSAAKQ